MTDLAVIFAGGGTGGHIFPALAILEALRVQRPPDNHAPTQIHARFVCSDKPLDAKILTGEHAIPIPARPFGLFQKAMIRLARTWASNVRTGRDLIAQLRGDGHAVVLVAMGGYVSPPIVQAARRERVPIMLVNLDAVPGRANRWIARRADRVLSVAGAGGFDAIAPVVRTQAVFAGAPADARTQLGIDPDRPTLFITGGSQGASTLDRLMIAFTQSRHEALDGWQVLHQARPELVLQVASAYDRAGVPARVVPFVDPISAGWGAADLALARAGAGCVGEVWANRVPAIFLPYPGHRDAHQRRNAQPLVCAGGALLSDNHTDASENLRDAGARLSELLSDAPVRAQMHEALKALGPPDGAQSAARAILELALEVGRAS